jgi:hypothetical protein
MSATNGKIILTIAEFADRANIHKDTSLRWLRQGAERNPNVTGMAGEFFLRKGGDG